MAGCGVADGCRQLRLAGCATDLDCFVEIEFQDNDRTIPKQVAGGKSGQSAEWHHSANFGYGVYLGRWRRDSKLNQEQRMQVAVKVMRKSSDRNRDRSFFPTDIVHI